MEYSQLELNWYNRDLQPYAVIEKAHLNSIQCLDYNPTNAAELVSGSHDKLL